MQGLSSIRAARRALLTTTAIITPAAASALIAFMGASMAPTAARALDVVCTPNASGTAITNATEACSGVGDKITYTAPATVTSTVTLTNVTIAGTAPGVTDAVAINPGANGVTVLGSGGSITAVAGDGIDITATAGAGTINVGTSTNRLNIAITGGAGTATAQGILVNGRGDVNLFTGAAAINGSSTGGGSWSIIARNQLAGSNPGGAVMVDALGPMTAGRGGILATTVGTDVTDTVTVITAGAITGLSGAGIQTSSVNGNSIINASAPVIGSIGAGQAGISETVTGTGNASLTTGTAATVQALGAATGVIVSTGAGGMTVNLGAGVTSASGTAIRATNSQATGTNTISLGAGAFRGLGTSLTTSIIDLTSASGGLITLTTAAGTAISSNSATTALQNADLAIKGTGGSVTINNAGSLRGIVDFSAITVATNAVTLNNSSTTGWQTTGTSTFGAGADIINNTGLISANGATTLAFGTGADVFNNLAAGTFATAQTAGASIATVTGLETFNNAGTISLQDGVADDVLLLGTTAYVGSGSGKIAIDAALGAGAQPACSTFGFADCVIMGAASGVTTITVNDSKASTPGALNLGGHVVVDATSASASAFVLGGSNVTATAQGPAIIKGFVQYQLAYDAANANVLLIAAPAPSMMYAPSFSTGQQALWRASADGWSERATALHERAQPDGVTVWGKAYTGGLMHDSDQSMAVTGGVLGYDTSFEQNHFGVTFGADAAVGGWTLGALGGYSAATLEFDADRSEADQTAWGFGAYASYSNGGAFVDALFKVDYTMLDLNLGGINEADGHSMGGKITVGNTLTNDGAIAITPQASVSYVHTEIDDLSDGGTTIKFDGGRSVRTSVGVRINGKDDGPGVRPFGYIGVGYEFSGVNPVNITSGSTKMTLKDDPTRTYGEVSAGFTFGGENGLSGFAVADGQYSSNESGYGVRVGFRIVR